MTAGSQGDLFSAPQGGGAEEAPAAPAPPSTPVEPAATIRPAIPAAVAVAAAPQPTRVGAAEAGAAPRPAQAAAPAVAAGGGREAKPRGAPNPLAEAKRAQESRPQRPVLSVGELTRQIKGTLEGSFPKVLVRGEVSGFRGANARGHLYFSLKDKEACVDTKVWASLASRLKFKLRDGMEVVVEGSIDLYEPQGRYSLIAQRVEPFGEGALALAFQQLKERLMAEGLFGERRVRPPRPLPALPRRIGVVTSITGAALRDFLRVLHARHPRLSVLVADARVQGDGAAQEVARAIGRLGRTDVDVIVVTRGGGSIEDLWAFNEEVVARAIFASPIPVVSAIGHEVDHTIADFVADYRAPTPSAAAERLAPVLRELELGLRTSESRLRKAAERKVLESRQKLGNLERKLGDPRRALSQRRMHLNASADRMARALRTRVRGARERQKALADRLARQHPQARLGQHRQAVAKLIERLRAAMAAAQKQRVRDLQDLKLALAQRTPADKVAQGRRKLEGLRARLQQAERRGLFAERQRLHGLTAKLDALSPLKVMRRGYSVTFKRGGHVVRQASDVAPGDEVAIRLAADGCRTLEECDEIDARVIAVKPGGGGA